MRNVLREELQFAMHIADQRRTRTEIADKSGVNIYQIDAILSRDPAKHRPIHANEALSLAFVLGPRAVNALLAMIGYAGSSLDEVEAHGPALVAVELMENVARFARCAADNHIDHTEEPITTAAADNVINLALPYSSRRA
jgi:hypothetical protein